MAPPTPVKGKDGKPITNGVAPSIDADENKRWVERAGWAPRFGNGETEAQESIADHQTWIEGKLDDRFYGGKLSITPLPE